MRIARVADQSGTLDYTRPTAECDQFEELAGSWEQDFRPTGTMIGDARLLAPLDPPVVYTIGLNYHDHAVETGDTVSVEIEGIGTLENPVVEGD